MRSELTDEHDTILDALLRLVDATGAAGSAPALTEIEETLTSGYARALALEGERWRLEQQLGTLAEQIVDGTAESASEELGELVRRISAAEGDLSMLRSLLETLRERASALRADQPLP